MTGSLPPEIPSMWQHHKGGQDLLCSAIEGRGQRGERSQQLGKTSQKRAAARRQDIPIGDRLMGVHICICSVE